MFKVSIKYVCWSRFFYIATMFFRFCLLAFQLCLILGFCALPNMNIQFERSYVKTNRSFWSPDMRVWEVGPHHSRHTTNRACLLDVEVIVLWWFGPLPVVWSEAGGGDYNTYFRADNQYISLSVAKKSVFILFYQPTIETTHATPSVYIYLLGVRFIFLSIFMILNH